ncbi:hypothetical protein RJD39_00715 [Vibrio scophthalmi]|uniref:Uncharacterized protein n=1 Tax=Vibrio scophthalmi TaxID=45658 RepID=A0A1E3WHH0_9VIBR|nr:hypothetical protein [Vibrio scophthalmi]ODS05220.1 hypothetical protein VSF3289_04361 [Vibrio scophthalmi]ODS10353.1 hypothetical protein VSF3289_00608 [Vibrio scophthalmi]ODS12577.1 hypothetical protein VSF3289_02902 [Vibrio scophthalmi]
MSFTKLRALTVQHKELEDSLFAAYDVLEKKGSLSMTSIFKAVKGGDLSALGLPDNFMATLRAYQQVGVQLRDVVDKIADQMEAKHA